MEYIEYIQTLGYESIENVPYNVRRGIHEAFDEQRRVNGHLETEVLSEDPEIGLERINRGIHEPDDLPFSDVDPEEMMLREMGVYE